MYYLEIVKDRFTSYGDCIFSQNDEIDLEYFDKKIRSLSLKGYVIKSVIVDTVTHGHGTPIRVAYLQKKVTKLPKS